MNKIASTETAKTAASIAAQTLEMMASSGARATSPQQPSDARLRRSWLDKFIRLQTAGDPALERLESAIYEFCRGYAKIPGVGRRMLIYGDAGCGKTHTARAVHRWARKSSPALPLIAVEEHLERPSSTFLHWPTIVDGFKSGEWLIVEEAIESSLLVVDDIGAEHDPSRIGIEKLYRILEARASRWTLLTSNVGPDNWETKFERRIASRFLRNCDLVDLSEVMDWGAR